MPLLVTVPLFRRSLAPEGYLLCTDQPGEPLVKIVTGAGIGNISSNRPLWIPLAREELTDYATLRQCGNSRQMMPLLAPDAPEEDARSLLDQSYHIAVQGSEPLALSYADYWLLEPEHMELENRKAFVRRQRMEHRVAPVAAGLDTWKDFENALHDDFELFQGSFFSIPRYPSQKAVTPMKTNLIRLLNTVRSENYEFGAVATIVRQDPALTVSLMRFINSPYIGVRNRVRSIQQAVTLLGQDQVRKWVTAAVFKSLGTDRPGELTKMSLVRAKFSENLSSLFGLGECSDSVFLVGLFSVLDVILGLEMEEALEMVPVTQEILDALISRMGPYAPILEFVVGYELADWTLVHQFCGEYALPRDGVLHAYLEAIGWYNELIQSAKPSFR